jgi:ubiquinone/menaquinone biosynthesis C-methylase UbiE
MGIYTRWVFPRLLDWTMRSDETTPYRRALIPRARGRVLEIGVGSGLNLPFYTDDVEFVIGLDPSPELLRMAALRRRQARVPLHPVQATAEGVPVKDASIDTVVMTWTLCSIPDAPRALSEMRRVLRPGGQLLFAEHGLTPDEGVARWQHRIDPFWVRISCHLNRPMDALISEAGFTLTELQAGYLGRGPKLMTYMYSGRATPEK